MSSKGLKLVAVLLLLLGLSFPAAEAEAPAATVRVPQAFFVCEIETVALNEWNAKEEADYKEHIANSAAGRVNVVVGNVTAARGGGINVPTGVQFLNYRSTDNDKRVAQRLIDTLKHSPEDVLPPILYGLPSITQDSTTFVEVDPSLFVAVDKPREEHNSHVIVWGLFGAVAGLGAFAGLAVILVKTGKAPAAIANLPQTFAGLPQTFAGLPGTIASLPGKISAGIPGNLLRGGWQRADFGSAPPASPVSPKVTAFVGTASAAAAKSKIQLV